MAKRKLAQADALDRWAAAANADPRLAVQMLLWKDRHRNPELATQITLVDLEGFAACVNYLEVKPEVVIVRPQGAPAMPGRPALGKRQAVAPRPAESPRPWVSVLLVEKGTMNSFKPIENNEEDARLRDRAAVLRQWKDRGPQIAAQLMADARAGVFSTATITEAATALDALARAS